MTLPEPVEGLSPGDGALIDRFGRAHTYLRLSVTDRCNYRCTYCMPEDGLDWMPRDRLLSFEEIRRIVGVLVGMGLKSVRLTGGEPTVRKDLEVLVAMLSELGLDDIAMTTNGHLFEKKAAVFAEAGLDRINVSLDSVDPDQFRAITRGGDLVRVLRAIDAARRAGLGPIKINAVMMRGVNDDQVDAIVDYFTPFADDTVVRFIEYMPFGADARRKHLPAREMRQQLSRRFTLIPQEKRHAGPATAYAIAETGLRIGFISPITEHFCQACNRLRLMADGHLRTCLSRDDTPSLRDLLREGATDEDLEQALREMVWQKVPGHEAHLESGHRAFEGVMTRIGG